MFKHSSKTYLIFLSMDLGLSLLAFRLAKGRYPIISGGHFAFEPIIKLLPGIIDLDRITALKAVVPAASDSQTGRFLVEVNALISTPCLIAPGLSEADFFDVDISLLPSLSLPKRFVAVNPNSSRIKSLVVMSLVSPHLARFKFIEMVLRQSSSLQGPPGLVLRKVSGRLIKELL